MQPCYGYYRTLIRNPMLEVEPTCQRVAERPPEIVYKRARLAYRFAAIEAIGLRQVPTTAIALSSLPVYRLPLSTYGTLLNVF